MLRLVAQSCPTLHNPMDCCPPGSSVHGILQGRTLQWVAIYSPGDLLDPGIEPSTSALQADSLLSELPGKPGVERINLKGKWVRFSGNSVKRSDLWETGLVSLGAYFHWRTGLKRC